MCWLRTWHVCKSHRECKTLLIPTSLHTCFQSSLPKVDSLSDHVRNIITLCQIMCWHAIAWLLGCAKRHANSNAAPPESVMIVALAAQPHDKSSNFLMGSIKNSKDRKDSKHYDMLKRVVQTWHMALLPFDVNAPKLVHCAESNEAKVWSWSRLGTKQNHWCAQHATSRPFPEFANGGTSWNTEWILDYPKAFPITFNFEMKATLDGFNMNQLLYRLKNYQTNCHSNWRPLKSFT